MKAWIALALLGVSLASEIAPALVPAPVPELGVEASGPSISKIFYINMAKDTKRNAHMIEVLNNEGIPYERVEGVNVKALRAGHYDYLLPTSGSKFSMENEVMHGEVNHFARSAACDVAHRVVFDKISREGPGFYLLLEDDVSFAPGWKQKFKQFFPFVPQDNVMARIGCWGKNSEGDLANRYWFDAIRRDKPGDVWDLEKAYYYGAHAIVLDPERARLLVNKLRHEKAEYADKFTASHVLGNTYCSVENLVHVERSFGSTRLIGGATPDATVTSAPVLPEKGKETAVPKELENSDAKAGSTQPLTPTQGGSDAAAAASLAPAIQPKAALVIQSTPSNTAPLEPVKSAVSNQVPMAPPSPINAGSTPEGEMAPPIQAEPMVQPELKATSSAMAPVHIVQAAPSSDATQTTSQPHII